MGKERKQKTLKLLQFYTIPLMVVAIAFTLFMLRYNTMLFIIAASIISISGGVTFAALSVEVKRLQYEFDALFKHNITAAKTIFRDLHIPAVICTEQGQVVMKNQYFDEISTDMYLNKIFSGDELRFELHEFEKRINDRFYIVKVIPVERSTDNSRKLLFVHLTDITLQIKYSELYELTKPVVVKIFVDNYDNISIENDIYSNTIFNKIEERIIHITNTVTFGIYRREMRSFLMIFEAEYLPAFEEVLSKLLSDIHSVKNIDGKDISLSIGVGSEANIDKAASLASEAIEMALGRGGDQAVVKRSTDASPKYYGDGKNNTDQTVSRVFVRSVANSLRELILDSTEVYIMGHRDEDVDCFGSALALVGYITHQLDKQAYFVCGGGLEKLTQSINTAVPESLKEYIVSPADIIDEEKRGALLIIVDTQREVMLSSRELYLQLCRNTVVIDHHRRSEDAIKNTVLSFMESTESSACEMVAELIENLSELKRPIQKFEATVLLAGIAMDTKGFVYNCGRSTFEAAAMLKKCGADSTAAMMMYQDDKKRFETVAAMVTSAEMYKQGVAITVSTKSIENPRPIIARAADSLVSLKGIKAAFVLNQSGDNVLLSARSTGEVNVQLVCEKLGGGGHRTVAGAQFNGRTCADIYALLKNALDKYFEEKEKTNNESDSVE